MGKHNSDTRTMRLEIYYVHPQYGRTLALDTLRHSKIKNQIANQKPNQKSNQKSKIKNQIKHQKSNQKLKIKSNPAVCDCENLRTNLHR